MTNISKTCSIENCIKASPSGRKGWCEMHYTRWRVHGSPLITKYDRSVKGVTKLSEYKPWIGMKYRCLNSKAINYADYGGRGIKVCDRWLKFANFYADIGKRPSPKHEIDRINNDGNYEPGNCRWATHQEQSNNRRSNLKFTIGAETKTLKEWTNQRGLKYGTIWMRIKAGKSIEEALS